MNIQRRRKEARRLFDHAYEAHMDGSLVRARLLYRKSIDVFPTAEAFTFLGWALSADGRYEEAIESCRHAIEIDPELGNPYNDIGVYLLELGQLDDAIPWLEQATKARRYDAPHFPYVNLGRAYMGKEMLSRAREMFEKALAHLPGYEPAEQALAVIRRSLN